MARHGTLLSHFCAILILHGITSAIPVEIHLVSLLPVDKTISPGLAWVGCALQLAIRKANALYAREQLSVILDKLMNFFHRTVVKRRPTVQIYWRNFITTMRLCLTKWTVHWNATQLLRYVSFHWYVKSRLANIYVQISRLCSSSIGTDNIYLLPINYVTTCQMMNISLFSSLQWP